MSIIDKYIEFKCFLFFSKPKTSNESRISDWSSYVCSSDLHSTIYLSGLPLAEVYFRRDGSRLVVRFASSPDDEIRLTQFFDTTTGLAKHGLRIDPGDGQVWDITPENLDLEVLKATAADDVIYGNSLDNSISRTEEHTSELQ